MTTREISQSELSTLIQMVRDQYSLLSLLGSPSNTPLSYKMFITRFSQRSAVTIIGGYVSNYKQLVPLQILWDGNELFMIYTVLLLNGRPTHGILNLQSDS